MVSPSAGKTLLSYRTTVFLKGSLAGKEKDARGYFWPSIYVLRRCKASHTRVVSVKRSLWAKEERSKKDDGVSMMFSGLNVGRRGFVPGKEHYG